MIITLVYLNIMHNFPTFKKAIAIMQLSRNDLLSILLILSTTVTYSHLDSVYSGCILNEKMSEEAFVYKTNQKKKKKKNYLQKSPIDLT